MGNARQVVGDNTDHGVNGDCTSSSWPTYQSCQWVGVQPTLDIDTDGIVPAYSAMALPGASAHVLMSGDSHFQLVNSPRLKTALLGLWNGGHGDPFFITNEK